MKNLSAKPKQYITVRIGQSTRRVWTTDLKEIKIYKRKKTPTLPSYDDHETCLSPKGNIILKKDFRTEPIMVNQSNTCWENSNINHWNDFYLYSYSLIWNTFDLRVILNWRFHYVEGQCQSLLYVFRKINKKFLVTYDREYNWC